MELPTAIALLGGEKMKPDRKQVWADLGCGKGLFTEALADLLPDGSHIHALDTDKHSLQNIPDRFGGVTIGKVVGDFVNDRFTFEKMDGLLMANSLHYVEEKSLFLNKLKSALNQNGTLLVVEYEARNPNPWVPYPVGFESLKVLLEEEGFSSVQMMKTIPSKYGHTIYAAIASLR